MRAWIAYNDLLPRCLLDDIPVKYPFAASLQVAVYFNFLINGKIQLSLVWQLCSDIDGSGIIHESKSTIVQSRDLALDQTYGG